MTSEVMTVVLCAALLHAAWNALVKACTDKWLMSWVLCMSGAVLALVLQCFLPLPAPAAWPFLIASALIHLAYFRLVARAYTTADMSVAYPLMRGAAPLFTALLAVLILSEPLSAGGWLAVALLSLGVIMLVLDGGGMAKVAGMARVSAGGWLPALANAAVIVAYTLIDASGVRLSGSALSYVCWLFLLTAAPMLLLVRPMRVRWLQAPRGTLVRGIAAGVSSLVSYGLVLWAMSRAPVPLVAALRETSVLFGALMAALLLHERFGRARWAAAGLVAAGAVAMKMMSA